MTFRFCASFFNSFPSAAPACLLACFPSLFFPRFLSQIVLSFSSTYLRQTTVRGFEIKKSDEKKWELKQQPRGEHEKHRSTRSLWVEPLEGMAGVIGQEGARFAQESRLASELTGGRRRTVRRKGLHESAR